MRLQLLHDFRQVVRVYQVAPGLYARGKVIVLEFWATWCGPCRLQTEILSRLYEEVGGEELEVSRPGDGPVHALDQALRAALEPVYPELKGVHLTDYKVRDLDSADGTAARVRVLIETSDGDRAWGTVGIHHNVIEASWQAMHDGIVVGLLHAGVDPA